jgi:tetratricopeptide (TPR) repeat protein
MRAFHRALSSNPHHVEALSRLDQARRQSVQAPRGTGPLRLPPQVADVPLPISPDEQAQMHYHKGRELLDRRLYREALVQLRQAVRLSPPFPQAQYYLGMVHDTVADRSRALAYYLSSYESDPSRFAAGINLADLAYRMGLPLLAGHVLERLQSSHPDQPALRHHAARLASLERERFRFLAHCPRCTGYDYAPDSETGERCCRSCQHRFATGRAAVYQVTPVPAGILSGRLDPTGTSDLWVTCPHCAGDYQPDLQVPGWTSCPRCGAGVAGQT